MAAALWHFLRRRNLLNLTGQLLIVEGGFDGSATW
jgi:hypothetical protein